jgi:hypothetical protein
MANADDPKDDNVVSLIPGMNRFGPRRGDYTTLDLSVLRREIFESTLMRYGYNLQWFASRPPQEQSAILQNIARALREEVESDPRLAVVHAALRQQLDQEKKEEREETETSAPDKRDSPVVLALSGRFGDLSGATIAWIAYVQQHYTETFTTASGVTLYTTRERAELYREVEQAFSSTPERRARIARLVQSTEEAHKALDRAQAEDRALTSGEATVVARHGVEAAAEASRLDAESRDMLAQIWQGTRPDQVDNDIAELVMQTRGVARLTQSIRDRLQPNDPEMARVIARINDLLADINDENRSTRLRGSEVLTRLRNILQDYQGANSALIGSLLAEVAQRDTVHAGALARNQERERLMASIPALRAEAKDKDSEAAAQELARIYWNARTQMERLAANRLQAEDIARRIRAGETVTSSELWRHFALGREEALMREAEEALQRAGRHELTLSPPPSTPGTPPGTQAAPSLQAEAVPAPSAPAPTPTPAPEPSPTPPAPTATSPPPSSAAPGG